MSSWPNVSRSRVIRYNTAYGLACLVFVGLYLALVLAGWGGAGPIEWLLVGMFGVMGVLALVTAAVWRREGAKERPDGRSS